MIHLRKAFDFSPSLWRCDQRDLDEILLSLWTANNKSLCKNRDTELFTGTPERWIFQGGRVEAMIWLAGRYCDEDDVAFDNLTATIKWWLL
jgi:hypothetical protein